MSVKANTSQKNVMKSVLLRIGGCMGCYLSFEQVDTRKGSLGVSLPLMYECVVM